MISMLALQAVQSTGCRQYASDARLNRCSSALAADVGRVHVQGGKRACHQACVHVGEPPFTKHTWRFEP